VYRTPLTKRQSVGIYETSQTPHKVVFDVSPGGDLQKISPKTPKSKKKTSRKIIQLIKKPPKSTQKTQTLQNSPIKEELKIMTKQQFKLYKICMDQISEAEKIICKICSQQIKAKKFESHNCTKYFKEEISSIISCLDVPLHPHLDPTPNPHRCSP
jgi:hypothetical protein